MSVPRAPAAHRGAGRETRSEPFRLAGRAINTPSPVSSDRCTVFMERDINNYLTEGYTVDEVLASFCIPCAKLSGQSSGGGKHRTERMLSGALQPAIRPGCRL